jgi:ABC-type multidrug transport system ATPase subunit
MIKIRDLQKIANQGASLDILVLTVVSGQVFALVGPAGSGLGTLWELLIGRSEPSAGSLRLGGIDPFSQPDQFSKVVGVLFAEDGLYLRQSPQANLDLHCQLYGLPKSRSLEILELIGMADQARARTDKLSSGLQRRLAFGRAILHHPQVLLLNDPFARCDEGTITLLGSLIRHLAGQGVSCLVLTDDAAHLDTTCEAIYTLKDGHLSQAYQPGEEMEEGSPAAFKIPARLEDKVRLVNPAEILYAEAEGGHACLQTGEARLPTQFTLSELEERLARSGFFRAHRSYLVNLQHVKEVTPYTRNSFSLRLDDPQNTEIPLSKSAAGELRELLGY